MDWLVSVLHFSVLASACDPYGLYNQTKQKYLRQIIKHAESVKQDPYELAAIAITESSLKPKAFSHTQDAGLFQVNCRWWYKKFKYKNIKECERAMFNPSVNIEKGAYILKSFRSKYKQCRGDLAYYCYNGGQGWRRSRNKNKILNYGKKVQERKKVLHKYYTDLIEQIRLELKTRS